MANIIITSTTNSIKVDFGIHSTQLNTSKGTWRKSHVLNILLRNDGVMIDIESQPDWLVSFDGAVGTFQIDSVDGVTPTSNSDLYDKLIALIS